jgi:hypothetical protein
MDDPFANVQDVAAPAQILNRGRYRLPRLDGTHKPYGWMRVSNLVSAYADQYALRQWEQRQMMQALRLDHALYIELVDAPATDVADDVWCEAFLERCKKVAGGSAGADHGNARHEAVEGLHRGVDTALYPSETRRMLALYQSTLARHGLVPLPGIQERRVLVEELEVVGTLDNVVRDQEIQQPNAPGAENLVADLKTQKRFWSFLEIGAQLACYAHGDAMWDVATGTWVEMPKVRRDVALVLWMPRDSTVVEVHEVDIVAGWQTARHAYAVVQDRSAAKKGRAWLRPAPPVTVTETYAALFAAVDSLAEGRALVAECKRKGVWSQALADSAGQAVDRLTRA